MLGLVRFSLPCGCVQKTTPLPSRLLYGIAPRLHKCCKTRISYIGPHANSGSRIAIGDPLSSYEARLPRQTQMDTHRRLKIVGSHMQFSLIDVHSPRFLLSTMMANILHFGVVIARFGCWRSSNIQITRQAALGVMLHDVP